MCDCCQGNQNANVKLNVEGMSCNHCKMTVEKTVGNLPGVNSVEVNLEAKTVAVSYLNGKVTEEEIRKAITDAGYDVK